MASNTPKKALLSLLWRQVNIFLFWPPKLAIFLLMLLIFIGVEIFKYDAESKSEKLEYTVRDTTVFDRSCDMKLREECMPVGNLECGKLQKSGGN